MSAPIEAFGPDSVLTKPTLTLSAACSGNASSAQIASATILILPPD